MWGYGVRKLGSEAARACAFESGSIAAALKSLNFGVFLGRGNMKYLMKYRTAKEYAKHLFLLFLLLASSSYAEEESPSDPPEHGRNSLVALPYAFYTPETGFALGVGSIYSFRAAGSTPEDRPSNAKCSATYTQEKQTILAVVPELYFGDEDYYLNGFYAYYKYPDKFWGIGNDTSDDAEVDIQPMLLR